MGIRRSEGVALPADYEDLSIRGTPGSPVKLWAGVGAAFVVLMLYIGIAWVCGDHFKATVADPDLVPTYTKVFIWFAQIVSPIVAVLFVYHFVVRQWRRTGHLTIDGMIVIGFFLCMWQDPLMNYTSFNFVYSSYAVNFGNWALEIPGWMSPRGNLLPEALLIWGFAYTTVGWMGVLLGTWVMRRAKKRWPGIGTIRMVLVAYVTLAFFDFVVEGCLFVRFGAYAWTGAVRWFTIFPGKMYQFPVYSALLLAIPWTAYTALRCFRNDRGESFVERGIENVRLSRRARPAVRLLAVIGFMQVVFLIGYGVPIQWFATHADSFPTTGLKSHLLNGMCGEGTPYDCPGPTVPIPREHSTTNRISPAG